MSVSTSMRGPSYTADPKDVQLDQLNASRLSHMSTSSVGTTLISLVYASILFIVPVKTCTRGLQLILPNSNSQSVFILHHISICSIGNNAVVYSIYYAHEFFGLHFITDKLNIKGSKNCFY